MWNGAPEVWSVSPSPIPSYFQGQPHVKCDAVVELRDDQGTDNNGHVLVFN